MKVLRNREGQNLEEFIKEYNPQQYVDLKPATTSDILIFTVADREGKEESKDLNDKALKILMIQRGNFPDINKWAVPGGFIEKNETALDAASRELEEETGIKDVYLEQLYMWDDPYRDIRDRVISFSHMALVDANQLNITPGSDADDARWFEVRKEVSKVVKQNSENGFIKEKYVNIYLTNGDMILKGEIKETMIKKGHSRFSKLEVLNKEESNIAFDHAMMIYYGLQRLKNKVEWTDIAFNLLPERFTIAEAHRIFQLTTGIDYTNQNFRKKYSKMMIETNETSKKYSPRPAKLYKLNIEWDNEEWEA